MALANEFRSGSDATAGNRSARRRALVMALAACSSMVVADRVSAAPPHHSHHVHEAAPMYDESMYETAEEIHLAGRGLPSPAVAGGHATHDPLWADYGKTQHPHASSGCAACDCAKQEKKPSVLRRAIGSMTSGFDRLMFGSKSKDCGCGAQGSDVPCDAMVPEHFHPMPAHSHSIHHQPFTKAVPGRVHLSPLRQGTTTPHAAPEPQGAPESQAAPGPVPVPRTQVKPKGTEPSDPFTDDQASRSSNPAVQQSGYYD